MRKRAGHLRCQTKSTRQANSVPLIHRALGPWGSDERGTSGRGPCSQQGDGEERLPLGPLDTAWSSVRRDNTRTDHRAWREELEGPTQHRAHDKKLHVICLLNF